MSSVWTSIVGVVGALLGSLLTYRQQRSTQNRAMAENRSEKRREEFARAVAAYASTASMLRRAEFDRAKKRLAHAPVPEQEQARQETYRVRTELRSAYYLVRLLADPADRELVRVAADVIELSRLITAQPRTRGELDQRSKEASEALDTVVELANARLRSASV